MASRHRTRRNVPQLGAGKARPPKASALHGASGPRRAGAVLMGLLSRGEAVAGSRHVAGGDCRQSQMKNSSIEGSGPGSAASSTHGKRSITI